jgi:hypothetical protein
VRGERERGSWRSTTRGADGEAGLWGWEPGHTLFSSLRTEQGADRAPGGGPFLMPAGLAPLRCRDVRRVRGGPPGAGARHVTHESEGTAYLVQPGLSGPGLRGSDGIAARGGEAPGWSGLAGRVIHGIGTSNTRRHYSSRFRAVKPENEKSARYGGSPVDSPVYIGANVLWKSCVRGVDRLKRGGDQEGRSAGSEASTRGWN